MIQKKRELHLSYSQAFGVALSKQISSAHAYSAGIHFSMFGKHLLIAKFREFPNSKRFVY